MPHPIEEKATKILIDYLESKGHKVEKSDRKTFDLIINGKYAEIKGKYKCFKDLDFISLSDRQYQEALKNDFDIYLVCDLENTPEIHKISSRKLLKQRTRRITSYEFDKSAIKNCLEK